MPGQLSAAELWAQILAEAEAEAESERQRLGEADRRLRDDIAAVVAANQAARDGHDEALRLALAEHRAGPEPLQLPTIDAQRDALHRVRLARSGLVPARRDAMADAADQVEDEWQTARAGLDARARKLADQVEKLTAEYREWWRLVREARGAVERRNPNLVVVNGPSKRMRPEPDPAAVVTAAANGVELCSPLSIYRRTEPVTGRTEMG